MGRGQAGQATLEAALIFPLLLMIVIGLVGVAQVLHASTITLLAANRGARLGAVAYGNPKLTPDDQQKTVTDAVKATLGAGLNGTDYTITITTDANDIHVLVTYNQHLSLPWINYIIGKKSWTTSYEAVYRIEGQ